jgi:hypothetical protein
LRDRETFEAGAADEVIDIWRTAMEVIDDLGEDGSDSPLSPYDVAAAASAAALRCAASGFLAQVAELVGEASRLLLDVAIAMPALPDGTRGMIWPEGADRSAAVGLPLLLLAQIEGVTDVEIEQTLTALLRLAESPFVEVRSRLVQGLELLIIGGVDGDSCEARRHEEVLAVLRELIASSGRVAAGHGRGRRERLDDVQSALASDSVIGDIAGMADAIPGLVALSRESCTHAVEAASLLNALIGYDRRVWPVHFARYGYADEHVWRGAIDSVVVGRILDGDLDELWRYLDAFGPVAEHLAGLLQKLASGADAGAKAILLHDLWPIILDRLLPDNRNLIAYGDGNRRPHYQDVRALDRVLLLTPDGAVDWPWERTIALWRRWVTAYESHPHLADRLVDTLNRAGLLADPVATDWVLLVLGTDAAAIDRGSNKVVAWIRYVLVDHPEAVSDRRRPVDILDGLVRRGDAKAIALQQEIES